MIQLTIDGVQVETQPGKTILQVALDHGIYIPTLCYLAHVNPIGSCRICLVEVAGMERPVASCTSPAQEGMEVKTRSERLTELRRKALQLIAINHPLDCPVCDKSGECQLQNLTVELGVFDQEYELDRFPARSDFDSPLIERNEPRCIRCGRCISVCHELQGFDAYRLTDHGYEATVDTQDGGPLRCDFCGLCVLACPVGAILNKQFKARPKAWELTQVASVCPYCGAGCRITLNVGEGQVQRVTPREQKATTFSLMCGRSMFGHGFIHSGERLRSPLLRRGGTLVPVSWDEALDFVSHGLESVLRKHGPGAIFGFASTHLTNEEGYLFQKFFRSVLGSNHLDSYAGLGYVQALKSLRAATGTTRPGFSFSQVEEADVLLVLGTDLAAEMPVPSLHVIRAAREKKAKLIHAYPRGTKLDRSAHLRLRYEPGTEISLLAGLAKAVLEQGLCDSALLRTSAEGFDDFMNSLHVLSWEEVCRRTGIDRKDILEAAAILARAGKTCILFGYDLISQPVVEDAVFSLTNLSLLIGILGREGSGLYLVTEKNNQRGLVEMGVVSDLLPGFLRLDQAGVFDKAYGKSIPAHPGKTLAQSMSGPETGAIQALYVMGGDPLAQFPNPERLKQALSRMELVVVQELFPTLIMDYAHCVLPAASFAEKEGTFTNADGKVQEIHQAIDPLPNTRPDWEILSALMGRMGGATGYAHVGEIREEIGRILSEAESGSSPLQLFSGKGRFMPVRLPEVETDPDRPYELMLGPTLFHCGTLSTRAPGPSTLAPDAWLEMNGDDFAALNLSAGDKVNVSSVRGSIGIQARVNDQLPKGKLFLPHHFMDLHANLLLTDSPVVRVRLERCQA